MIEKGQDAIKGNRIFFLDNLRTFRIFCALISEKQEMVLVI